jgi:EAL domain-containing protein (putative c-di-GMP-specific phosphodiesterase class I)
VLEITESLLVDEHSTMPERLSELRAIGLSLAVDDFGTGYSSLGYLQRFPIDIIKIDRSFVDGLGQTGNEPGVVRAIIDVAQRIGARTVAEGIQGAEQLKVLKKLRCDGGQGFYFARPMPAADFTERLASTADGDMRLRLEEAV